MRWQDKLKWQFITHRNYIKMGLTQFDMVKLPIQFYLMASAFVELLRLDVLKGMAFWTGQFFIIGISVFILLGSWVFGWWWDKIKAWDMETDWSNQRNPQIIELLNHARRNGKVK